MQNPDYPTTVRNEPVPTPLMREVQAMSGRHGLRFLGNPVRLGDTTRISYGGDVQAIMAFRTEFQERMDAIESAAKAEREAARKALPFWKRPFARA